MRQPRRKLSQRRQPVSLLFDARGFADPVRHQTNQTLGQLRHLLHEFREQRSRKSQNAPSVTARPVTVNCFIREKGSTPVTSPALLGKANVSPPNSPRHWNSPFKNHEHRIGRITLADVGFARIETQSPAIG